MVRRDRVRLFTIAVGVGVLFFSCKMPVGSNPGDRTEDATLSPWNAEGLPEGLDDVIPLTIVELAERTLEQTIHRGTSPPDPGGSYLVAEILNTMTTVPDDPRHKERFADIFIRFKHFDHVTGRLDIAIIEADAKDELKNSTFFAESKGTDALISGSGNLLTVFATVTGERLVKPPEEPSMMIPFDSYLIISAERASSGGAPVLRNFSYSYIMHKNHGNDEHLIPDGTGRSFVHHIDYQPAPDFHFPDRDDFENMPA